MTLFIYFFLNHHVLFLSRTAYHFEKPTLIRSTHNKGDCYLFELCPLRFERTFVSTVRSRDPPSICPSPSTTRSDAASVDSMRCRASVLTTGTKDDAEVNMKAMPWKLVEMLRLLHVLNWMWRSTTYQIFFYYLLPPCNWWINNLNIFGK